MTVTDIIPVAHFEEVHAIDIRSDLVSTWTGLTQLDIFDSSLTRLLFALRGITLTTDPTDIFSGWDPSWARVNNMFEPVEVDPPRLLTLMIRADGFGRYRDIRIGWDFQFRSVRPDLTRVITRTRVFIPDHHLRFRRMFRAYWYVIRLPSGAIRLEILRMLKNMVET